MKKQLKRLDLKKINIAKLENARAIQGGGTGAPGDGSGTTRVSNGGDCYTDRCN